MPKLIGVILAGGGGARLGGAIKANLKIGGVRLVDRVVQSLQPQVNQIILSRGKLAQGRIQPRMSMAEVPDPEGVDIGPVAGLSAAVSWCQTHAPDADFLLSVAVDTPFFPVDFAAQALFEMKEGVDCVAGSDGERVFPTNALWRLSAIAQLPQRVAEGQASHGLKAILEPDCTHILHLDEKEAFLNINTISDVITCGQKAAGIFNP